MVGAEIVDLSIPTAKRVAKCLLLRFVENTEFAVSSLDSC